MKSLLRKYYGRHDLVKRYGISVSQMTMDFFVIVTTSFMTYIYHRVCTKSNTIGAPSGAGAAPNNMSSSPVFSGVRDSQISV